MLFGLRLRDRLGYWFEIGFLFRLAREFSGTLNWRVSVINSDSELKLLLSLHILYDYIKMANLKQVKSRKRLRNGGKINGYEE